MGTRESGLDERHVHPIAHAMQALVHQHPSEAHPLRGRQDGQSPEFGDEVGQGANLQYNRRRTDHTMAVHVFSDEEQLMVVVDEPGEGVEIVELPVGIVAAVGSLEDVANGLDVAGRGVTNHDHDCWSSADSGAASSSATRAARSLSVDASTYS
jgi:hypothetical protein